eukprot:scaffold44637_cov18-Tisochrysis_lutea.AAC.1
MQERQPTADVVIHLAVSPQEAVLQAAHMRPALSFSSSFCFTCSSLAAILACAHGFKFLGVLANTLTATEAPVPGA